MRRADAVFKTPSPYTRLLPEVYIQVLTDKPAAFVEIAKKMEMPVGPICSARRTNECNSVFGFKSA